MLRRVVAGALLASGVVSIVGLSPAGAQTFPTKQITMVVPFAAGGPTDTLGRILAERMSKALGQTVIVENTRARPARSASPASRARRPTATRSGSATGARTS